MENAKTIYQNLSYLNKKYKNRFKYEDIFKVAHSRLGWYRISGINVVNYIASKELLETKIKDSVGLLNTLSLFQVVLEYKL